MTCLSCLAKDDEIAYLRERLGDRLIDTTHSSLRGAFGLTFYEAKLVTALYQARTVVKARDLFESVKTDHAKDSWNLDGNIIAVMIGRIRKKLGVDFVCSARLIGYWLPQESLAAIAEALEASRTVKPFKPPQRVARTNFHFKWDEDSTRALELMLRNGYTYDVCAKRLGTTRGSVAWGAKRYIYGELETK